MHRRTPSPTVAIKSERQASEIGSRPSPSSSNEEGENEDHLDEGCYAKKRKRSDSEEPDDKISGLARLRIRLS